MSRDARSHALVVGVSSDGAERVEAAILDDTLLARRYFGGCLLSVFKGPIASGPGATHELDLAWNGATTSLAIDGKPVSRTALLAGDDLGRMVAGLRVAVDDAFRVSNVRAERGTRIAEAPADREFASHTPCPDLAALLREPPQEERRGIALKHFPAPAARAAISEWIDLLPDAVARSVKNVLYVEDARASLRGGNGEALLESRTIVLKASQAGSAGTFFHEAAHLHDHTLHISLGVPDDASEWAAISGASCYAKGSDMEAYWKAYQATHVANGILGPQGGQCASEDLAIWVGTVYEAYVKRSSIADLLDPKSPRYSDRNSRKLEFLLRKGFFAKPVLEAVTRRPPAI